MAGYYRTPTLHGDQVVFGSEGELWSVPLAGGTATRLTDTGGHAGHPRFSPDGDRIAFSSHHQGHLEAFVMPASGGTAERVSWLGGMSVLRTWLDKQHVLVSSNAGEACGRMFSLHSCDVRTGQHKDLCLGPSTDLVSGSGMKVLARHAMDISWWKRYRGGTAGDLWIDRQGRGQFQKLIAEPGNYCTPFIVGKRVYFIADIDGVGNIHSCTATGRDLQRHTHHEDYYVRGASNHGRQVVYAAGGRLYHLDLTTATTTEIEVDYPSSRPAREPRFLVGPYNLDAVDLDAKGQHFAATARGHAFRLANWSGPLQQLGAAHGVRYRHPRCYKDGLLVSSDAGGEEHLEILSPGKATKVLPGDSGEVTALEVSPKGDKAVFSNHRNELVLVNLPSGRRRIICRSSTRGIAGVSWSPDGRWLAYGRGLTGPLRRQTAIFLYDIQARQEHQVSQPVRRDLRPSWDPAGNYLYFLSYRVFDPAYDAVHFELGFPFAVQPCLITLRKDLPDPFRRQPPAKSDDDEDEDEDDKKKKKPLRIDLTGIRDRCVAFPVQAAEYTAVIGCKGKALFVGDDAVYTLAEGGWEGYKLDAWTFSKQSCETLAENLYMVRPNSNRSHLLLFGKQGLRVVKAGEKPAEKNGGPGPSSGLLDLSRIRFAHQPTAEWQQIFDEAWRLQREHFWTADMSKVDWRKVYRRYAALLERINTRAELNDLLWEMQGELGTSHAYVVGGDVARAGGHRLARLGADLRWDHKARAWRIDRILRGDPWASSGAAPLCRPGIDVKVGEHLLAIGDQRLSASHGPQQALLGFAGQEVTLTLRRRQGSRPRQVVVGTLAGDEHLRYRDWVEANRDKVHRASAGRLGYLHIPNMMWEGYAEFHRGFLAELDRDGLIIDVRFNGGGHVSQLLLEKLARKRIGYDQTRWSGVEPYPYESPAGPMVCLTNQFAGSDGDIFSHCFKAMGLGPLIGTRTWGGVIGISPKRRLVDGGITTQPEYSFHFDDVGWDVENYGTDPDIVVDKLPQDYRRGKDPQLERAIAEAGKRLPKQASPRFRKRPDLRLPKLS